MEEIQIKEYSPDYQECIDLMMEGIQLEYPERITTHHSTRIHEVYRKEGQKYWVALSGSKVAGTIGIVIFDKKKAVLKRMMVGREFRGEKAGTAGMLMSTALEWASQQGAEEVFLGTMEQFVAAQRFYLKNGYTPIPENELPAHYPQNPMDSVFFKKKLS